MLGLDLPLLADQSFDFIEELCLVLIKCLKRLTVYLPNLMNTSQVKLLQSWRPNVQFITEGAVWYHELLSRQAFGIADCVFINVQFIESERVIFYIQPFPFFLLNTNMVGWIPMTQWLKSNLILTQTQPVYFCKPNGISASFSRWAVFAPSDALAVF